VRTVLPNPLAPFTKTAALAFLALCVAAPAALPAQIVLSNQSASAGASVLSPVAFASQASSVSGVQFDLQYNNSAMSLAATLSAAATNSGKTLFAVNLAPNKKRFLIAGVNQNLIPDGTLMNLSVNISLTAPGGVYALTLSNLIATDPSGKATLVMASNGSITVNAVTGLQPNGVVNAGSFLPGPVAPGELVTLIGSGIGPVSAHQPTGSASSNTLGGTSVLFNGIPAPLLYAAPTQINAIVPFGVSGKTTAQVTVTAQDHTIASVALAVAASAPAIFTLDTSGSGPGAILNQDSSVNSPSNSAAKGSIIAIFATGAGQTNPPGVDGHVTQTVLPAPLLPVSVRIGGLDCKVVYAGAAPELISGVVQVNAVVPAAVTSGPSVPILLAIGTATSQAGVTVAIR
jgi:uncharacterized protein (TIGR03437 family)